MQDRDGKTIHLHDYVEVQTAPDGPVSQGQVVTFHPARRGPLVGMPLVAFDNGTHQYMGGEHLRVVVSCGW